MQISNIKGFSLIEVVVAVAIISILAGISIPNLSRYRGRAQDIAAKSEAVNFYTSSMMHFATNGESVRFNRRNLPDGFARNMDITYRGRIRINAKGRPSGVMLFQHTKSSNRFLLLGSTGKIYSLSF